MGAGSGPADGPAHGAVRSTLVLLLGAHGWTLVFVALGWLFLNGFRVVLSALLPAIKADLAIGNAAAGLALTVLWLLYATLQFPSGITADQTGERPLLVVGTLLAGLSFGAFFLAPGYGFFLVACALFGVGAGLFGTPRDMLLTRTYPNADNTAYGVTFAAGSLGAAALPYVATTIAAGTDWRVAVVWMLPPLLIVGVGLVRVVSPRGDGGNAGLPARETVRRTLAALAEPRVLYGAVVMLVFIFTYQGMVSFLPTYLVEAKGLDQSLTAALFGALFIVGAGIQSVAGNLADRFGGWRVLLGLLVLSTVTLGALPFLGGVVALGFLVPLLGIRVAIGPIVSAFIVRELPGSVQGTGWGFLRTVFFGLGATSSTLIGVLADIGYFDAGFLLLAGLTGLAAICWWRLPRNGERPTSDS